MRFHDQSDDGKRRLSIKRSSKDVMPAVSREECCSASRPRYSSHDSTEAEICQTAKNKIAAAAYKHQADCGSKQNKVQLKILKNRRGLRGALRSKNCLEKADQRIENQHGSQCSLYKHHRLQPRLRSA